jgi:thiol-disulfide isomerase/thioredoxin
MSKNLILQALFFFLVFHFISWVREASLLDSDGSVITPNVLVTEHNGTEVNLNQYKGTPVLYYFWAPWCTVCKVSMPNLEDFKENNPNVKIVAIALSYQNEQEVINFIESKDYSFTSYLGNINTAEAFKIKGFPTYYIADEEGRIVSKSMGYTSEFGMKLRSFIL